MTQYGSFPDRPRGRRERPDHDVPDRGGRGSAPWGQREFPDLEPVRGRRAAEAGNQRVRSREGPRPGAWGRDEAADSDDPMAAFSERWERRGAETPDGRRGRWRLLIIGGSAVAVVIAVVLYFTVGSSGKNGHVGLGSIITSFLPGEIRSVPNACDAVTPATLSQYLPGKPRVAAPPLDGGQDSQCTWTLDAAPVYRVIEIDVQAYSPSGLATGDGSATFAAIDAYAQAEQVKQQPASASAQPKATVTDISGLGNQAFGSMQVFRTSSGVTDVATVIARYRNVIVTATVNGLDQSVSGKYGPVSQSTLTAAARAAARDAIAKVTG